MSRRTVLLPTVLALALGAPIGASADPETQAASAEPASAAVVACPALDARIHSYRERSTSKYANRLTRLSVDERRLRTAEREAARLGCPVVAAVTTQDVAPSD